MRVHLKEIRTLQALSLASILRKYQILHLRAVPHYRRLSAHHLLQLERMRLRDVLLWKNLQLLIKLLI